MASSNERLGRHVLYGCSSGRSTCQCWTSGGSLSTITTERLRRRRRLDLSGLLTETINQSRRVAVRRRNRALCATVRYGPSIRRRAGGHLINPNWLYRKQPGRRSAARPENQRRGEIDLTVVGCRNFGELAGNRPCHEQHQHTRAAKLSVVHDSLRSYRADAVEDI